MAYPGWATDELAEEWVEPSTSPPHEPSASARALYSSTNRPPIPSLNDKRGSLRSLGHAAPRGLPSFRSPAENRSPSASRIVSGVLVPSGEFVVPFGGTGLLSPPSSRSSCEEDAPEPAGAVGTCVVNTEAVDDRGGHLAKGVKGKDIFGKNPLERMFDPPSPPSAGSSDMPPTPSPMPPRLPPRPAPAHEDDPAIRRASHPYAPARPSRLSKSMTPSSNGSTVLSEAPVDDTEDPNDQSLAPTLPEQEDETALIAEEFEGNDSRVFSTDVSPLARGATRFPFTFSAPMRGASNGTGAGSAETASGSATVRGTIRSDVFKPANEGENGPNHSTLRRSPVRFAPESTVEGSARDPLRLFRSTYDTVTREHLSAIVDSIAVEQSPPGASGYSSGEGGQWSHEESGEGSDDSRGSKRMRLSPPSPPFEPKDWGRQGLEILGRIKGRPVESTTSASASPMSRQEEPTFDYPSLPPTPPLDAQPDHRPATGPSKQSQGKHRSNPSTASSGYLRAAEEIMNNLRNRVVSDSVSASALESSPGTIERRPLSETDDNVGSSETDAHDVEGEGDSWKWDSQNRKRMLSGVSLRSSPESAGASGGRFSAHSSFRRSGPAGPSSNQRLPAHNTDDLNRFVSATTVPTCTTISTSFVKHAGPRGGARSGGMRMIRPEEVGALVGETGNMQYDPALKLWVRQRGQSELGLGRVSEGSESRLVGSEESVDVFAGMSEGSLRSGGRGTVRSERAQEDEEVLRDDEGGAERTAEQSVLGQGEGDEGDDEGAYVEANTTVIEGESSVESFDDGLAPPVERNVESPVPMPNEAQRPITPPSPPRPNVFAPSTRPVPVHANSAPAIMTPFPSHLAPRPVRSALRNANGDTPLATKKTAGWALNLTPAPASAPPGFESATRSVSFSDGRRHGQIEGLDTGRPATLSGSPVAGVLGGATAALASTPGREMTLGARGGSAGNLFDESGQSLMNSARTRRIAGLLHDMEDLTLNELTPSKPSRKPDPVRPPLARATGEGNGDETVIVDSAPFPGRVKGGLRRARSFREGETEIAPAPFAADAAANATFVTEKSFAVAHDQLVRAITDVQPFEPYWETLDSVDVSGKGLESLSRLKEFLPGLDEVKANDNAISYLTGVPSGVRSMSVAGNRLTALASVGHLLNLQFLDLSRNQLDSVQQLSCLLHLRELRADHNRISDLTGILGLDSLLKVSVRANRVDVLDLSEAKWAKLESLDLAENGLGEVKGLERLKGVVSLNFDDNDLTTLSAALPMTSLRSLRVSRNDLSVLDLSNFPKIRTLYADQNRLARLRRSGSERGRLEALSLRSQRVRGLRLDANEVGCAKRLYISGNEMQPADLPPMAQLRYLEAAACRFTTWPDLARMPLLEVLNANYNFLESLEGLKGAKALRKVMLVGNRLCGAVEELARPIRGLGVEEIDLRMNPTTLGFYLPLFIPAPSLNAGASTSGLKPQTHPNKTNVLLGRANTTLSASRMSGFGASHAHSVFHQAESEDWEGMDREFRRNLPDVWYGKRLVYRGLVMRACERVVRLDGVLVGDAERKKAGELLLRAGR